MTETVGWLGTWLRLLWRHWPVLFALAAAAVLVRRLLISYVVVEAARCREGLGGELAFAILPVVMLTSMLLMFRVVRPSLPFIGTLERSEPVLRYVASVAVAFVAFYFTAGYLARDYFYFAQDVGVTVFVETLSSLGEPEQPLPTFIDTAHPEIYLAIAAGAFVLRLILGVLGSGRRTVLGLLAVYPEVLWVTMSFFATNLYLRQGRGWFARTRVYEWATNAISSAHIPGLTTLFPSLEGVAAVLVIPVTALVTGTTVLMVSARPRQEPASGVRRLLPGGRGGPSGGQFGALWEALRQVFQAGVPATMLFCLGFAALSAAPGYLAELERVLIGPRDYVKLWRYLEFPLIYLNESITLILIVSLIAAFVDRTAARRARLSGPAEAPVPPPAPADLGLEQTQRIPAGPAPVPGGPGYGVRSPYGQPATGSPT